MPPINSRVGAVLSWDEEQVQLLGYGRYDGMHAALVGPFGMSLESYEEIVGPDAPAHSDHRITLDDGQVVWGSRCIWAPEQIIKERIGFRRVILVAPPMSTG